MLRRTIALAISVSLLALSASAQADSGSLADPTGDYPDILKLSYDNAASKVTMAMTYSGVRPQNESFYLRWGTAGRSYQVFNSPSVKIKELRYYATSSSTAKKVACSGLVIKQVTSTKTSVVIPRSCLGKAPNALRFQGIATEGVSSVDETKISKLTARG